MTSKEVYEQRLDDAIAVMRRVIDQDLAFDMRHWYSDQGVFTAPFGTKAFNEGPECGTAACFAGHIAKSPEFVKNGWYTIAYTPFWDQGRGDYTPRHIAQYFGWSEQFAEDLCAASDGDYCDDYGYHYLYDVDCAEDISPEMVLNVLLEIKSGNLDPTQ